ncbi:MAG: hypothetical protein ACPGJF_03460 [Sinimarinibacterium flocculans]|uniref:TolB family protein n=1 Tax=Sinimarinibacterium flocculans TaxID=985250 RepID=UPI003C53F8F8
MKSHAGLLAAVCAGTLAACASAPPENVRLQSRLTSYVGRDGVGVREVQVRSWGDVTDVGVPAAALIWRLDADERYIDGLTLATNGSLMAFPLLSERPDDPAEETDGKKKKRDDDSPRRPGVSSLVALRFATEGITQITPGQSLDLFPAFGPDSTLTFSSNRIRPNGVDLFRISAERPGGIAVVRQTSDAQLSSPSVADDGTMSYSYLPRYAGAGNSQIWALGGSLVYPVLLREGSDPAISPSGEEIAFVGTNGQIWAMPTSGVNPVQLTFGKIPLDANGRRLPKRHPHWSPDGKYVVFAAADGRDADGVHNYDVWIVSRLGGDGMQLTTNGSHDVFPRVSPSGAWIYFVSNRGFGDGIWRIPHPHAAAPAEPVVEPAVLEPVPEISLQPPAATSEPAPETDVFSEPVFTEDAPDLPPGDEPPATTEDLSVPVDDGAPGLDGEPPSAADAMSDETAAEPSVDEAPPAVDDATAEATPADT